MINGGWIKLSRSMQEWEWWSDEKMVKFFLYLLFNANTREKVIDGVEIPRGSLATSYSKMAQECGFSVKQLRGMLDKLIRTNEVAKVTSSKFTIITIKNYSRYQGEGKQKGNQRASEGARKRASEGQESKNKRNIYNNIIYIKKNKEEGADAPNPFFENQDAPPEGFSSWEEFYNDLRK